MIRLSSTEICILERQNALCLVCIVNGTDGKSWLLQYVVHFGEAKRVVHPHARPPPRVASPVRSPFAFEEREIIFISPLFSKDNLPFLLHHLLEKLQGMHIKTRRYILHLHDGRDASSVEVSLTVFFEVNARLPGSHYVQNYTSCVRWSESSSRLTQLLVVVS